MEIQAVWYFRKGHYAGWGDVHVHGGVIVTVHGPLYSFLAEVRDRILEIDLWLNHMGIFNLVHLVTFDVNYLPPFLWTRALFPSLWG